MVEAVGELMDSGVAVRRRDTRPFGEYSTSSTWIEETMDNTDLNAAFQAFAKDFVDSAKTEEDLALFASAATTAWNASMQDESMTETAISTFIDRFACPTLTVSGATVNTGQKIRELAERRHQLFPDIRAIIRALELEDRGDGLHFKVTQHDEI